MRRINSNCAARSGLLRAEATHRFRPVAHTFSPLVTPFLHCAPDTFFLPIRALCSTIEKPASSRSHGLRDQPEMPFRFRSAPPQSPVLGRGSWVHRGATHNPSTHQSWYRKLRPTIHEPWRTSWNPSCSKCRSVVRTCITPSRRITYNP